MRVGDTIRADVEPDGDAVVQQRLSGGILTLTINRPRHANAINGDVSTLLARSFAAAGRDAAIRAVIVTAVGDRFFSAGADVTALLAGEDVLPGEGLSGWGLAANARTIPQPVIAAVNGAALGGGFELALNADFIIAAESATFAFPETNVGIFPGSGGVFRLQQVMPRQQALDVLMTGRTLDASAAHAYGVVHSVVASDHLAGAARDLATVLAAKPPRGIRAIKQIFRGIEPDGTPVAEADSWAVNDRLRDSVLASDDAKEGFAAFSERRAPVWTGR